VKTTASTSNGTARHWVSRGSIPILR